VMPYLILGRERIWLVDLNGHHKLRLCVAVRLCWPNSLSAASVVENDMRRLASTYHG
jgi:hypothetical protein